MQRSVRRVRCTFPSPLAPSAFTMAPWSIQCLDSFGSSPTINAVLLIPGQANCAELSLSCDLVDGSVYQITGNAVTAAAGAGMWTGSVQWCTRQTPKAPSPEVNLSEVDAVLFGIDLAWASGDFVETAQGDLATIGGAENARTALVRRATSEGLPWAPKYGVKPRKYVDGSSLALPKILNTVTSQFLRDNRVKAVSAKIQSSGEQSSILAQITFIDGTATPVTAPIQTS